MLSVNYIGIFIRAFNQLSSFLSDRLKGKTPYVGCPRNIFLSEADDNVWQLILVGRW